MQSFLLGFLTYGIAELFGAFILARYFPKTFWHIVRAADRLRNFLTELAVTCTYSEVDQEEEDGDETGCSGCYECGKDEGLEEFLAGSGVAYNDQIEDSYGVLQGTVVEVLGATHEYFVTVAGPDGLVNVPVDEVALLEPGTPVDKIIPEGTAVIFIDRASHYRKGVTLKAMVVSGDLTYVIEYGQDSDVLQTEVLAFDVFSEKDGPAGPVADAVAACNLNTTIPNNG